MSNEVFPSSLPGVDIKVRRTVMAPPVQVRTTPSQREYRARDATLPRYAYEYNFNVLRSDALGELQQVVGFFNRHGGDFDTFLLLDEAEPAVSGQVFGVGNGSAVNYALVRTFGGFVEPVDAIAPTAVISVNGLAAGNLLAPTSGFEVDTNADGIADGWVSYTAGSTGTVSNTLAPGAVGAGSGSFYQACQASALNGRVGLGRAATVPVTAGLSYSLSAEQTATGGSTRKAAINWLDSSLAYIGESVASTTVNGRLSCVGTAPPGAARAAPYLWAESAAGAGVLINFDDAQFEIAEAPRAYSPNLASVPAGTGAVTFALAPASGAVLTWSGTPYRRVRFARGQADMDRFLKELWSWRACQLISSKV